MNRRVYFVLAVYQLGFTEWVLADKESDKEAYCKQYNPNFKYFCGGPGSGDNRLGDFCHGYAVVCNIPWPPTAQNPSAAGPGSANPVGAGVGGAAVPKVPTASSPEMCYQYQYLAQSSCTNPATENANTRYYCNYYRQFCSVTEVAPGIINTGVPAPADARCGPYQKQFEVACIRQPITVATAEFCQSYITYCSNYQAPQPAPAPVAPAANPALPGQLPSQSAPGGVSPAQIQQLCDQYQSQALQYCKGGETGQVKELCDKYRQYCIKSSRRRRAIWM